MKKTMLLGVLMLSAAVGYAQESRPAAPIVAGAPQRQFLHGHHGGKR